jgi:HD-GYP domain-containing protein (c-di-GMP phosphodiesterase class II)
MYVAELDRPWLGTPFAVQGFYIRSMDDALQLAEFCDRVFVDPRRYDPQLAAAGKSWARGSRSPEPGSPPQRRQSELIPAPQVRYQENTSVEDELPAARDALDASTQLLDGVWEAFSSSRHIRITDFRSAIDPLVDSILRNKDALVALMRVRRADQHTHEHCLAMAVWAGLMGRQLGLLSDEVKKLALGCFLADVGMVRLPPEVLRKDHGLSCSERLMQQSHVDYSLELLADMGGADGDVAGTVRWHHERRDGSGYPDGLDGGAIPMFARIAGILDRYDDMISPRDAGRARSSFQALTKLQEQCPAGFQPELVEQYAQAVGLFPSGCLVELSTGEVGVVFSQNTGRRLRPRVMLILDPAKRRRDSCTVLDLNSPGEQAVRIARELPRGAHGIDAREYFL